MSRAERKIDHIHYALSTGQSRRTGLDHIQFVHQSLPGSSVKDISLSTEIGGLQWSSPIFVNAMTGGGGEVTARINTQLAEAAAACGIPMAVGSQMSALRHPEERATFEAARKANPKGIMMANIGAEASVEEARAVCEMIEADILQIHLNVVQELAMPEGDRDFRGAVDRIASICETVKVPVIVKETGFGISAETARLLNDLPLAAIDTAGFGGTNFAAVENERAARPLAFFNSWGIPTAVSIVEALSGAPGRPVIASGGLQYADDVVKSLALGASAAGLSGFLLNVLMTNGQEALVEHIEQMKADIKMMMCALGARSISHLHSVPLIISGETCQWLQARGLKPERFALRVPVPFDS
ncbi:type 2 isopentenyl-diphosphate Delta-isomerase [Domibacillus sp. DTU_2020_1001157_1_SI_ALB_TIR_016]|uniref:type 2 isopentenyl-diphosphate Delta-isomerase n=1 Tax=Domibacillus sp. DTU_2020_1001157_1_SI_ALB_TIR_016 TaxID=3077789 RepID=UPI0028EC4799|nr:type 2 isopentenyl-diphosphate Delta-isomerase [Domibacillus sp. DTU_2020_1001157_1_SI_ALB_TIR_016]WNS82072.1 type 2 isopentenyl-diphosphate Delta-isomerase [Domibacillus sp. DTU_2020_1001157_1_SI_ALB_TIR_016]